MMSLNKHEYSLLENDNSEKNELKFFSDCVKVDFVSSESSQASVHFGRERYLGIKVVVKQY